MTTRRCAVAARSEWYEKLDGTREARSAGEPAVGGDERAVERLGEGHVAGVVGGHVVAQCPRSPEKGAGRVGDERGVEQIEYRVLGLVGRQAPNGQLATQNRENLDTQQVGSCELLASESLAESGAIGAAVRDRRREDRCVNDEHGLGRAT